MCRLTGFWKFNHHFTQGYKALIAEHMTTALQNRGPEFTPVTDWYLAIIAGPIHAFSIRQQCHCV